MRQKSETRATTPEQIVKDIRRATRKHHSAEEKIRIVLEGLRGEYSIAELCRREGIAESLYHSWSKEFLEAGKKRLAGAWRYRAEPGQIGVRYLGNQLSNHTGIEDGSLPRSGGR
jgi:transposase